MILITGGSGFFGLHLGYYLANQGQKVLLLSRHPVNPPSFLEPFWEKQVKPVCGDIIDLPGLTGCIRENSVESIIHAATANESEPLYQGLNINLGGIANVLEAARLFNLKRVTFISSVAVYLGLEGSILKEDVNLPQFAYVPGYPVRFTSSFKKAGEGICFLYAAEYGLSVPVVRVSRGYGPGGHPFTPLGMMVEGALAGKPVDLSKLDSDIKHNFIYVRDVAKGIALVHLAGILKHQVYNLGDTSEYSLSEAAHIVREIIPGARIRLGAGTPQNNAETGSFDLTRIQDEMGYSPDYNLRQGINNHVNWNKYGKYGD